MHSDRADAKAICRIGCKVDLLLGILFDRFFGRDYAATRRGLDANYYRGKVSPLWQLASIYALHFHLIGWRRGLKPTPLFDTDWYVSEYHESIGRNRNPFAHYMRSGWIERLDPSADFKTNWYIDRYADVAAANVNPLLHYQTHGAKEGRMPKPPRVMGALADELELFTRGDRSAFVSPVWTLSLSDFASERIVEAATSGWSTSMGNDPQFLAERSIEAGFIEIKVHARLERIREPTVREAVCEIYFDPGNGDMREQAFVYAFEDGVLDVDDVIFVEQDAHRVRFDPINTDCDFIIDAFELRSMPLQDAVAYHFNRYCLHEDSVQRPDRAFMHHMKWSTVSRFVKAQGQSVDLTAPGYERWMAARRISPDQRPAFSDTRLTIRPSFSILMPTYKSDLRYLKKAIDSVRSQLYASWDLCIVDDGSDLPILRRFLDDQALSDARIRVEHLDKNVGIAAATNRALAMAEGDFIALLDHDDELAPQALYMMAKAIDEDASADMLYSDEDKMDVDGNRTDPMFKPDWSPELFMGCMYTCHLGVYRRSLVEAVGGFRSDFDFAQDYDMAFRVSAKARSIVHVPDILYHWRVLPTSTAGGADAKPTAELAARRAVQAHIDALDLRGTALPGPFAGSHRVKLEVIGEPSISIVIPTAGRRISADNARWFVLDLLKSLRDTSTYRNFEIVLVDNGDLEPALEKALSAFDLVRIRYDAPVFNIAEKLNLGVEAARNEYVILLNDDMTIITPDWMEELVSWVQRPGIVAAGAKLLFPDRTVQHAGILLLAQGPSHPYYGAADVDAGLVGSAILARNYSAITGACLAVAKRDYQAVGGFDPALRINYNDVDFCLKLLSRGRIVYTPYAKLYHYESVSKDEAPASELRFFNERWGDIVGADPFYNIHYSQSSINAVTPFPRTLMEQLGFEAAPPVHSIGMPPVTGTSAPLM